MWRACRDSLPTKVNLRRRHIVDSSICERCLREDESSLHALWSCKELDSIWADSVWNFRQAINPTNFKELLSWILNNHGQPELFAMTTWGIWNQRNHVRLHKPCCASDQIATQAKERLQEFCAVLPPKPPRTTRTRDIWKPPDAGHFKINFDGAIFRNENRCGIGVVIRDHTGSVIASLVQNISLAYQPIEVEALAAARALEFGQEIGKGGAVLEGDSELIINSLKAGGNTIASVEPLIQDVILFSNS